LAILFITAVLTFGFIPAQALPQKWESAGPDGGSFVGVVTHPANADAVVAITAYPSPSNVFRSNDRGENWSRIGSIPEANIGDVASFDFSRLYANAFYGCYFSTDGGANWSYGEYPSSAGVGLCVCVHPTDPDLVYSAGYSFTGGIDTLLFLQSADGGQTWTSTTIDSEYTFAYDIAISESNPDVMYICGNQQAGSVYSAALYRSADGGLTWTDISASVDTAQYCYLYTVEIDPNDDNVVYTGGNYFYKSTDGGATWAKDTTHTFDAYDLDIDPADTANLYMATSRSDMFVSADHGQTWTFHEDVLTGEGVHVEVVDLAPSTIFVACTNGGLFRSLDSGATWNLAQSGVHGCNIASLSVADSEPEILYADIFSASTLMASYDSGSTWHEKTYPAGCSGTICELQVCSIDPNIVLALEAG